VFFAHTLRTQVSRSIYATSFRQAFDSPPGSAQRCLLSLSRVVEKCRGVEVDDFRWLQIDSLIESLTTQLGVCEKIRASPLPFNYSHLLRQLV
jgi:predicted membrane chloride channel (bestrophin family)